jgi:hypothetical protein
MDDALRMGVFQSITELFKKACGSHWMRWLTVKPRGKRRPGDKLHDQRRPLTGILNLMEAHDVSVRESGECGGLSHQPLGFLKRWAGGAKQLDGHLAVQDVVNGFPDLARPAAADCVIEGVADAKARARCHRLVVRQRDIEAGSCE